MLIWDDENLVIKCESLRWQAMEYHQSAGVKSDQDKLYRRTPLKKFGENVGEKGKTLLGY